MKFAQLACAFGRHQIDEKAVKHIHAADVGPCRHCRVPMEQIAPHVWEVQRVRDAGLGPRNIR